MLPGTCLSIVIIPNLGTHGYAGTTKAQRMRSLGWADFLKVEMSPDHKTLVVSYWVYVALTGVILPRLSFSYHSADVQYHPKYQADHPLRTVPNYLHTGVR